MKRRHRILSKIRKKNIKKEEKLRKIKMEIEAWKYINIKREVLQHFEKYHGGGMKAAFYKTSSKNGKKKSVTGKKRINIRQRKRGTLVKLENQKKKLKKKKAAGENKVKNKAQLYSTNNIKYKLLEIIQRIWRREGFLKN